jgi:Flp pilus assembly protein TadG
MSTFVARQGREQRARKTGPWSDVSSSVYTSRVATVTVRGPLAIEMEREHSGYQEWNNYCNIHCTGLLPIAENTAMKTIEAPGSSRKRPRPLTSKRRLGCGTEGGQSLVELALILPLLLLLLVGIIEIGRFSYYSILVANAARAGAQYGAQSLITAADVAGIRAAAHNDGLPSLAVTPRQLCGCTGATLGACSTIAPTCVLPDHPLVYVQVTATHRFPSLFNYPGLPASLRLTSTEKMRVAQ